MELLNNPDYHFVMSLLPYFQESEIQNVILSALKRKRNNLQTSLTIQQFQHEPSTNNKFYGEK